jgi:hypothetical protein
MSLELYKSFIERLSGKEYISLAHYPKFEDETGALGYITQVYIDGTVLKGKGYFLNTPDGIAAYNAIRRDRRENVPYDERIRISIGFYDYAHTHGDNEIWKYDLDPICKTCAKREKTTKTYLDGLLDHFALTRKPALPTTSIEVE